MNESSPAAEKPSGLAVEDVVLILPVWITDCAVPVGFSACSLRGLFYGLLLLLLSRFSRVWLRVTP